MSWQHIAPLSRPKTLLEVEFAISNQVGKGRDTGLIVLLTLRTQLFDACPGFLKDGGGVRVSVGSGDHFGILRIEPGSDYRLGKSGGPGIRASGVLNLRFRRPDCVKAAKCRGSAEFDYGDDWLEVTIPQWALVQVPPAPLQAKAAPAAPIAPPKPAAAKAPFVSAIADVKHNVRRGA